MVAHCQFLNELFGIWGVVIGLEDAIDVDGGSVDALRVQLSILYDLINLCDDTVCSCGHICIKVAFGLLELEVSHAVCTLSLH